MHNDKLKNIAYWVTTGLIAVALIPGGAVDAAALPPAVAFLAHLGYPAYFVTLIGVWKVLGGIVTLAPKLPRLKEWAYAGIVFDFSGAAISHMASGDGPSKWMVPLVFLVLALASWGLRPQSRRLGSILPEKHEASAVPARAAHGV
jgi:hypothetical protein